MYSLLLVIIYIAFISLGLPDSLLGSAWPVMYKELEVPMSYAGIITMIIAGGTIVSSLFSDRLTRKLGAGLVTAISVLMTAVALFGFSLSSSIFLLCLWAVPYGLGAGAVDAALNNYVALHYTSRHMSWLHCFWGVGVAVSPYIMSYSLTGGLGWNNGYRVVSIMQIVLTALLFLTLPLWNRKGENGESEEVKAVPLSIREAVKLRGVKLVLVTFFCYCAVEATAGLWASSYLVGHRGISAEIAAKFAALFYMGITVGRFICGFVADRLGDKRLIRIGIVLMTGGRYFSRAAGSGEWGGIVRPCSDWFWRCANISVHYSCNTFSFWKGEFSVHYRDTDGQRLCGEHIYTACFWTACRKNRYRLISLLSDHICSINVLYIGEVK